MASSAKDRSFLLTLSEKSFENIVGKGENAVNQHFLLFPQCFYPVQNKFQFWGCIQYVTCKCFQFGLVKNFVVW